LIPRIHLATARIPGQAASLNLHRHDRDFILSFERHELMTSRSFGSEEQLAELAMQELDDASAARVLVGGLGMGFTLARTLELVGSDATVEVVELVPEVIDWNRQWFAELNRNALADPRTDVRVGDVGDTIAAAGRGSRYDAILLDVDNGPEALTDERNSGLYDDSGLAVALNALRPGGVMTVWSSNRFDWFTPRLRRAGFDATERTVRARRTKGARHTIWIATHPRTAPQR
jgi:spermidine synthase